MLLDGRCISSVQRECLAYVCERGYQNRSYIGLVLYEGLLSRLISLHLKDGENPFERLHQWGRCCD